MPIVNTNTEKVLQQVPDLALVRLVYVSSVTLKSRFNASMFEEVEKHAYDNNKKEGITGILCYGNGQFLQCIEGSKKSVLAMQQRIFSDTRHKNMKVLLIRAIDQRAFTDWRMRRLFLERWLWSPATKKNAMQLSSFLPFSPYSWSNDNTEKFLAVIKNFETTPHVHAAGITYNAVGNMVHHIAAPHQAFLVVQGFLTVLLIVALLLLF